MGECLELKFKESASPWKIYIILEKYWVLAIPNA